MFTVMLFMVCEMYFRMTVMCAIELCFSHVGLNSFTFFLCRDFLKVFSLYCAVCFLFAFRSLMVSFYNL